MKKLYPRYIVNSYDSIESKINFHNDELICEDEEYTYYLLWDTYTDKPVETESYPPVRYLSSIKTYRNMYSYNRLQEKCEELNKIHYNYLREIVDYCND